MKKYKTNIRYRLINNYLDFRPHKVFFKISSNSTSMKWTSRTHKFSGLGFVECVDSMVIGPHFEPSGIKFFKATL